MRSAVSWRYVLFFSAFLTGLPGLAGADTTAPPEDVAALRAELLTLQKQMADLAARIEALQGASPASVPAAEVSPPPAPAPAPVAEVPPALGPPEGSAVPTYNPAGSSKVFNPDIAVIGDFLGAMGRPGPDGEPSLELHEAELSFQAVVDPYARADFFLVFGPDEVGVEEGFVTFPTLPGGFLAKVGKTRDVFGKVNAQHNHVLPFTDRPLVTKNLTGGEDGMSDYGITLSRLIPNRFLFLEATGQVYRGRSERVRWPRVAATSPTSAICAPTGT